MKEHAYARYMNLKRKCVKMYVEVQDFFLIPNVL